MKLVPHKGAGFRKLPIHLLLRLLPWEGSLSLWNTLNRNVPSTSNFDQCHVSAGIIGAQVIQAAALPRLVMPVVGRRIKERRAALHHGYVAGPEVPVEQRGAQALRQVSEEPQNRRTVATGKRP